MPILIKTLNLPSPNIEDGVLSLHHPQKQIIKGQLITGVPPGLEDDIPSTVQTQKSGTILSNPFRNLTKIPTTTTTTIAATTTTPRGGKAETGSYSPPSTPPTPPLPPTTTTTTGTPTRQENSGKRLLNKRSLSLFSSRSQPNVIHPPTEAALAKVFFSLSFFFIF